MRQTLVLLLRIGAVHVCGPQKDVHVRPFSESRADSKPRQI